MQEKDIKEYELGEHCFGQIVTVNGVDYEDIPQEDIIAFINDMILNDINAASLREKFFTTCLEYLDYDCTESSSDLCDQCGNFNTYGKYEKTPKKS